LGLVAVFHHVAPGKECPQHESFWMAHILFIYEKPISFIRWGKKCFELHLQSQTLTCYWP